MVDFILTNFISSLIDNNMENIYPILDICHKTIERYKYVLDKKMNIDIQNSLTTLVNIDKIDNQLHLQFVENLFEDIALNNKILVQKGNKIIEVGSINNEHKFSILTQNEKFFVSITEDRVESFKKREGSPISIIPDYVDIKDNFIDSTSVKKKVKDEKEDFNEIDEQSVFQWKNLWYPLISIDCVNNNNFPVKECQLCKVKLVPNEMRLRKLISRKMYYGVENCEKVQQKTDINIGKYFWENITKCQKCNLKKIINGNEGLSSRNSSYDSLDLEN